MACISPHSLPGAHWQRWGELRACTEAQCKTNKDYFEQWIMQSYTSPEFKYGARKEQNVAN